MRIQGLFFNVFSFRPYTAARFFTFGSSEKPSVNKRYDCADAKTAPKRIPTHNFSVPPLICRSLDLPIAPPNELSDALSDWAAPPSSLAAPPNGLAAPPNSLAGAPNSLAAPPSSLAAPPSSLAAPPNHLARPPNDSARPPTCPAAPLSHLAEPPHDLLLLCRDLSQRITTYFSRPLIGNKRLCSRITFPNPMASA